MRPALVTAGVCAALAGSGCASSPAPAAATSEAPAPSTSASSRSQTLHAAPSQASTDTTEGAAAGEAAAGEGAQAASQQPKASTAHGTATNGAGSPAALPSGTKMLHVGDSFAAALGIELGKLLRAAGMRTWLEYKTASYVPTWASGPELPKLISTYNPDLVLVTLGANELEIPDPEQRAGAIQRLVKKVGDRPCVWILPPLWKQDTGLMQVIKENARPCKVLDSSALVKELPRGPDHIHPNAEGRATWALAVFDWLKKARAPEGPKPWSLRENLP